MGYGRYIVTVYIADKKAPTIDENGKVGTSRFGHLWLSLDDNEKVLIQPYGFHPSDDGWPATRVGKVKINDNYTYMVSSHQVYKKSFPIDKNEYEKLLNICEEAKNTNTFGPYVGSSNACVDFVLEVLSNVGIGKSLLFNNGTLKVNSEREGHIWPSDNKYLIDAAWNFHMRYVIPSQISGLVEDKVSPQISFANSITSDNSIGGNLPNADLANFKSDETVMVPTFNKVTFNSNILPNQSGTKDFCIPDSHYFQSPDQLAQDADNIAYVGNNVNNGIGYSNYISLHIGDYKYEPELDPSNIA